MLGFVRRAVAVGALLSAFLLPGCASSGPTGDRAAAGKRPVVHCESGTLGLETAPITRTLRKERKLPLDLLGSVVTEVLPGGPAAAAGVLAGDVIERLGAVRITSDCGFLAATRDSKCEPVRVTLWRAGAVASVDLVPVERLPFYEKSCGEGNARGCVRHAGTLWARNGEGDRERALELYQTACRNGSGEACAYAGRHLMDRPGRAKDSIALLARSCELQSAAGCAHHAFLFATGKLVKKDDRRAKQLYVRSCELGDALGCYNVALMADQGRGGLRNPFVALTRYEEACLAGSATACTNLGFLYEKGQGGVPTDLEKAVALYQRGCEGSGCQGPNSTGCVNVGRAYRDGTGVPRDPERAATIFRQACDREPDPEDPGAEENRARACSLLGALYLAGNGVERDTAKGKELSELGCERGDAFGCFNAAVIYADVSGADADPVKAASFLDRACQRGDAEGCHDLAVAYEKGSGVKRDRRRAGELFVKACKLGFQAACAKTKKR